MREFQLDDAENCLMGGFLQKVKRGDPLVIPAPTFNTFIDAARDFQDRQRSARRELFRPTRRQIDDARSWLVRVIARRAVDILKAQETGP
jgi:hypothetical protein